MHNVKNALRKYGIQPTKLRGQNFLVSDKALGEIVEAAELTGNDTVLEIGPGFGVLTEKLIGRVARVVAVETDSKFVRILKERFAQDQNFEIIENDILKTDIGKVFKGEKSYKLVANIPYNITSDILIKFLAKEPRPALVALMIQKEVAERITEENGKSSRLSVFVNYFGKPEIIARVPKTAFYPAPKVDSAILKIVPHERAYAPNAFKEQAFFECVRLGFSSPRKKVISNLMKKFQRALLFRVFDEIKISRDARPEDLHVSDWQKLYAGISLRPLAE